MVMMGRVVVTEEVSMGEVRESPKIEAMLADKESQVLQGYLTSFVSTENLPDIYFADCERDKNKEKTAS